jgi:murein DD-endopeptidase MepM/ murein hydrolase activator NlpD
VASVNPVTSVKSLNDALKDTLTTLNSINQSIKDITAQANDATATMKGAVSKSGQKGNGKTNRQTLGTDTASFSTARTNVSNGGTHTSSIIDAGAPASAFQQTVANTTSMPSQAAMGVGQIVSGAGQIVGGIVGGIAALAPDLGSTVSRAGSYYTSSQYSPTGLGYTQLQRSTLSAINGKFGYGISGMGDDAAAAAQLVQGYGYAPGSAAYLAAMGEVGGASRLLNMNNATAAQAIGGLQTGSMGANLYQYGINQFGPNGQPASETSIAQQLYKRIFQHGATSSQVQTSLQYGLAGADLNAMGFSADQQAIFKNQFLQIANGQNPDLASASGVGNPTKATQQITASQTAVEQAGQKAMIQGYQDAANVITAVNRKLVQFGSALDLISKAKGFTQGMGTSNVGKAAGTFLGGLVHGIGSILEGAGSLALMGIGGGNSGFGAAVGGDVTSSKAVSSNAVSPINGMSPTVAYGVTGSNLWNTPAGNSHKGQDYAVPIGTSVQAVAPGVVFNDNPGFEYGTTVQIDHRNGYTTLYGHLSSKSVKVGDNVSAKQVIAKSGESGNVTGPHLHFEVRKGKNNPVDPSVLLGSNFMSVGMVSGTRELTYGTVLGTGSQQAWAKDFLTKMGDPVTSSNMKAVTTWMAYEGGQWNNSAHYNPINTTLNETGATNINSAGVKSYVSYSQGLNATTSTLNENQKGYAAIREALKKGNSTAAVLSAINGSAWGTHIPSSAGGGNSGYGASMPASTTSTIGGSAVGTASNSAGNTNNITINVSVAQASEAEAVNLAKRVKTLLADNNSLSIAGRS